MDRPNCDATTKRGAPYGSFAVTGGRCVMHDPGRSARIAEARSRGAAKANRLRLLRGRRPKLDDAAGLVRFNADLIHRLLDHELEVDVVRCIVYALSLQRQLIETGDLAARLEALEQRLADQGSRKWA